MSTTISNISDTYTPLLVDGYSAIRTSRNVLHPIIGSHIYALTLRESALRSGKLRMLFEDAAIAENLIAALSAGEELNLISTDRPNINMSFVSSADVALDLDDDTRDAWWVTFEYQETD